MTLSPEVITAAIGGIVTLVTQLITLFTNKRNNAATIQRDTDVKETVTNNAAKMAEIHAMTNGRLTEVIRDNQELKIKVALLTSLTQKG